MKPKKILVACGTGVATSTIAAMAIEKEMKARGHEIIVQQCKVSEINSMIADFDLVVATTQVPFAVEKPVIVTLAFLTGVGKKDAISRIEEALQ